MNMMKYSHIHVLKYYGLHNAALFAQRMVHKLDPLMSLGGGGGYVLLFSIITVTIIFVMVLFSMLYMLI